MVLIRCIPFVMQNNYMPVGRPFFIEPSKIDIRFFFGFLDIIIYIPRFLHYGILLSKFNKLNVLGVGLIFGVFFSEEIMFAVSLGCKIIKIRYRL